MKNWKNTVMFCIAAMCFCGWLAMGKAHAAYQQDGNNSRMGYYDSSEESHGFATRCKCWASPSPSPGN
jgi:hypothetical protein